jgi:hypothetical protein
VVGLVGVLGIFANSVLLKWSSIGWWLEDWKLIDELGRVGGFVVLGKFQIGRVVRIM